MEATGQNHRDALVAAVALVKRGAQAVSVEDVAKSGRTGTSIATTRLVVRPVGPSRPGRAAGHLLTKSDLQLRKLKSNLWRGRAYL
ncbi:hypothetical protein GGD67_002640 [Bradyrhizobium sp. IAR9]|uniref:hypothetical protein n=1 Tax=Bradyrhizobium sp. IAR9 TaxID=2663841 RepID=UPI0015C6F7B6|nr:hypothetical protein [Bradyrhizobium sp. IAR9]NYG45182.1 hypothetical protein [Bradyrhizobium sp. IAR9]